MSLVDLRALVDAANAPTFDRATSPLDRAFAYDFNEIRKGIQLGSKGIKTRDLEVVADSILRGILSVSGNAAIGGTLTVTDLLTASGGASVAGNIAVTGTVGGMTPSTHQHTGSDGSTRIPLDSVSGVTAARTWSTHTHAGDGAGQIQTAGYADGSVTAAKVASSAYGLTSSLLARGDYLNAVRARLSSLLLPAADDLPMVGQWISLKSMLVIGSEVEAAIVEYGPGSPTLGFFARKFVYNAVSTVRFSFPVPSFATNVRVYYVGWTASGASEVLREEIAHVVMGGTLDSADIQQNDVTIIPPSLTADSLGNGYGGLISRLASPAIEAELVSIKLTSSAGMGEDLYLAGAFVTYDINYEDLQD
jgi:hypothetical protein